MSSKQDTPLLVLGLGNPLRGDDGLGIRAIEMLAKRELPPEVTVADGGTPGWGLVSTLQDWSRVILVDAAQFGGAPGSWCCIHLDDLSLGDQQAFVSLHAAGVLEALSLAQALGTLPQEITLYCVEPERLENGAGFSPAVEAVLPEFVNQIYQDIIQQENGRDKNEPKENPPHR
jgi:hydrogenase maturation protease